MTAVGDYQYGLKLAQEGRYSEAIGLIRNYLESEPGDGEGWNDAGVVLYELGLAEESAACFERSCELSGVNGELYRNLLLAYIGANNGKKAGEAFCRIYRIGQAGGESVGQVAESFLANGQKSEALEFLLEVSSNGINRELTAGLIDELRSRRAKIAFFCGGDGQTFLGDILDYCRQRYEVRIFEGNTVEQISELMQWSDISWFEWCTNLAEIGSKLEKVCKIAVRLHRYEAYLDWPSRVNWRNVDRLITVGNSFVRDALRLQVGDIEKQTTIVTIPNGVNLDKFAFKDRVRGKNIAFVANLRMVKNPMFLLQCMDMLRKIDGGYRLYFAGRNLDEAVLQYVRYMIDELGLGGCVFIDGWQGDMKRWLDDKHYIVCTSVIESQGMGLLEGMAGGLKPVIHNFPGARQIFPVKYLFNTAEEFCGHVLSDDYRPAEYRMFVERAYPLDKVLVCIDGVLRCLEGEEMDANRAKMGVGGGVIAV